MQYDIESEDQKAKSSEFLTESRLAESPFNADSPKKKRSLKVKEIAQFRWLKYRPLIEASHAELAPHPIALLSHVRVRSP